MVATRSSTRNLPKRPTAQDPPLKKESTVVALLEKKQKKKKNNDNSKNKSNDRMKNEQKKVKVEKRHGQDKGTKLAPSHTEPIWWKKYDADRLKEAEERLNTKPKELPFHLRQEWWETFDLGRFNEMQKGSAGPTRWEKFELDCMKDIARRLKREITKELEKGVLQAGPQGIERFEVGHMKVMQKRLKREIEWKARYIASTGRERIVLDRMMDMASKLKEIDKGASRVRSTGWKKGAEFGCAEDIKKRLAMEKLVSGPGE